jgi:hypothetical protein
MDDGGARDVLVGGWRLVSWETRAADGQVTHPMGTDPIGYVLYTADGRFSIAMSRRDRAGFAAGDVLGGTTEEKARAVEGFVAYAGRYSFHGDRVIHHAWRPVRGMLTGLILVAAVDGDRAEAHTISWGCWA